MKFSANVKTGMTWLNLILQTSYQFVNLWFYWVMRPKTENQENQEKDLSESHQSILIPKIPKQKSFISQL